jgi:hypothetical protein
MAVEIPLPRGVTKDQALYHIRRLRESCELIRSIDSGSYPLRFYSSGEVEHKKMQGFPGEKLKKDEEGEPVSLPVFGTTPRDTHCLRFAVTQAIFSDLQLISEWGGHDDAIAMVNESRLIPKKGTIYERH